MKIKELKQFLDSDDFSLFAFTGAKTESQKKEKIIKNIYKKVLTIYYT